MGLGIGTEKEKKNGYIKANRAALAKAQRKFLAPCKAAAAGKIRRAETNITPTAFTATATVKALRTNKILLSQATFTPIARAETSSKAKAKRGR